jgi:starch synthase (maltosyl-transferring)
MTGSLEHVMQRQCPPSSIVIEDVRPIVNCGRYAVKREAGDVLVVTADIFKDGHDLLAADLKLRTSGSDLWLEAPMRFVDNDRWGAEIPLSTIGAHEYTIVAYPDDWGTWLYEIGKKIAAGLDVSLELQEGIALLTAAGARTSKNDPGIAKALDLLNKSQPIESLINSLRDPAIARSMKTLRNRNADCILPSPLPLYVDRQGARYAAWYELFPRSAGTTPGKSGTFQDVIDQLPRIAAMGFDVLYFPPIHPIGTINRKGKNNSVVSSPSDPGVPYAIGSSDGGHDAIDPQLGDFDDLARLISAAKAYGLEIALDLAIQSAPDHPWATEHPDWFTIRPDGSIKFAENPPKRYEDIYPVNFLSADWKALWEEMKRLFLFWAEKDIRIFRVDNPHTKPTIFWEWLITEVHRTFPDVLFLSESFTRPKVMKALAKAGFTQSYSYFTWRNEKQELIDYFTELTQTDVRDYMRANLFTNTPDINPYYLQTSGRAGFKVRHLLAATLSSVYGIYSGFELCEGTAVPGKEEYLNSEKYEIKVWDWDRPGNISADITRVNDIRRQHAALHEYDNLRFYWAEDAQMLCYGKSTPDHGDNILVVVNLDPHEVRAGRIWFDPADFGFAAGETIKVTDLISGRNWEWSGGDQWVRLDPAVESAHIFHFQR